MQSVHLVDLPLTLLASISKGIFTAPSLSFRITCPGYLNLIFLNCFTMPIITYHILIFSFVTVSPSDTSRI